MWVDQAKIFVKAADGGDGCVSFRREKYVPRGGPDGGDGGRGGDVVVQASRRLSTLVDLRYRQRYVVRRAGHGQGKNRTGRNSDDCVIRVPIGTQVLDLERDILLADLTQDGQSFPVACGGRGGRGNVHFTTSTCQAPTYADPGQKGEERWLRMELKLLADVGLIGFPNAGKSTLLSRISSATPRIAEYPFTTLIPQLGVVGTSGDQSFIVADIPGLIEGAHEGKGLGTRFLRHIERTRVLAVLVDISETLTDDPVDQFQKLRHEMASYHPSLVQKPYVVVATKLDIRGGDVRHRRLGDFCRDRGDQMCSVSAVTGEGLPSLIRVLYRQVAEIREACGPEAAEDTQIPAEEVR